MVRAWVLIVVLMLFLPNVFAAIDQAAPSQQNLEEQIQALLAQRGDFLGTYAVTAADMEKARADLLTDYRSYSDEQFIAFDNRLQQFTMQFRQKVIIGLLGINLFVAGAIFYYLNKRNKGLSYESVAIRRGRSEEERQFMVQNMNYIRDRLKQIEAQNAQMFETYVMPIQRFMEYEQARWKRENQEDVGRDEQQGGGRGGGESGGDYGEGSDGGFESSQYGAPTYEAGFPMEGEYYEDQNQYQY